MSDAWDFQAIEIDAVDAALSETAVRKRIPSTKLERAQVEPKKTNSRSEQNKPRSAPRKPLSLEVPDYLATELRIAAATQSVTVRHLVLTALVEAGYRVEAIDMDEDGRRMR